METVRLELMEESLTVSDIIEKIRLNPLASGRLTDLKRYYALMVKNAQSSIQILDLVVRVRSLCAGSDEIKKWCNDKQREIVEQSKKCASLEAKESTNSTELVIPHHKTNPSIYSGKKSTFVPSLKDQAIRTIRSNLNSISDLSKLDPDILRKALETSTLEKITIFEKNNPELVHLTEGFWKYQCNIVHGVTEIHTGLTTWRQTFENAETMNKERLATLKKKLESKRKLTPEKRKAIKTENLQPKRGLGLNLNKNGSNHTPAMKKVLNMYKAQRSADFFNYRTLRKI